MRKLFTVYCMQPWIMVSWLMSKVWLCQRSWRSLTALFNGPQGRISSVKMTKWTGYYCVSGCLFPNHISSEYLIIVSIFSRIPLAIFLLRGICVRILLKAYPNCCGKRVIVHFRHWSQYNLILSGSRYTPAETIPKLHYFNILVCQAKDLSCMHIKFCTKCISFNNF
jgi:hypothetical protein